MEMSERRSEPFTNQQYETMDANKRIDEIHEILEQSQWANTYPDRYMEFKRLTAEQHFALWDEMWGLICKRNAKSP